MTRKVTIGLVIVLALLFGGLLAWSVAGDADEPVGQKPKILLMTSLPIVWGDGASMSDILSGKSVPAPVFEHWRNQYDIKAVDSLAGLGRSPTDIIILAQPKAMAPADLSDLDSWVRAGGRALILTDPLLLWHSDLPLGDSGRPLASGLLSPLLDHWGLELIAPAEEAEGITDLPAGQYQIQTGGVGSFAISVDKGEQAAKCQLGDANIIARCNLEKGRIILVADADFIDDTFWVGEPAPEKDETVAALRFVDELIADLRRNRAVSKD